jgi:hypothetical protein
MSPWITKQAKFGALALAAGLMLTGLGASEAQSQSFNVRTFECTTDPFGVRVDVRGLGNTNICIVGEVDVDLNCACVGGGNNCPRDAKKQTTPATFQDSDALEPKNGRVVTTFTLAFAPVDGLCTTEEPALTCPSGQTAKLISYETDGAHFTMCTTSAAAGEECNCDGATVLAEQTCGPTSDIVFGGRRGSCAALFQ